MYYIYIILTFSLLKTTHYAFRLQLTKASVQASIHNRYHMQDSDGSNNTVLNNSTP
jgi:hypothetical protein